MIKKLMRWIRNDWEYGTIHFIGCISNKPVNSEARRRIRTGMVQVPGRLGNWYSPHLDHWKSFRPNPTCPACHPR